MKKKIFSYIEYFNINISRELTMTSSEIPLNEIKLPNDYKPSENASVITCTSMKNTEIA